MIKYNEASGWYIKLISALLPPLDLGAKIRGWLYKPYLKKCGRNFMVPWKTHIFNPNKLSVGNNVYLGYNSYYGQGKVDIGHNVLIGPFVSITATNHVRKAGHFRNKSYEEKKITIGNNCWIGAHVCVLAGVNIGRNCLIGAGSIVTKNIPSNSIAVGNPAKVVKKLK
jgi:maltose O-acetyltransferase